MWVSRAVEIASPETRQDKPAVDYYMASGRVFPLFRHPHHRSSGRPSATLHVYSPGKIAQPVPIETVGAPVAVQHRQGVSVAVIAYRAYAARGVADKPPRLIIAQGERAGPSDTCASAEGLRPARHRQSCQPVAAVGGRNIVEHAVCGRQPSRKHVGDAPPCHREHVPPAVIGVADAVGIAVPGRLCQETVAVVGVVIGVRETVELSPLPS